jgi:hypothetical protein
MADIIEAFLGECIEPRHQAYFDDIKHSDDSTVRLASDILSELYECYEDEPQTMDKDEWDHLERVRLALLSGHTMTCTGVFVRQPAQIIAVLILLAYAITILLYGFGWNLVPIHCVLSAVGIVLLRIAKSAKPRHPFQHLTLPFTSLDQLSEAYRQTSTFVKRKMPKDAPGRKPEGHYGNIVAFLVLFPLAPAFLFMIGLEGGTEYRITAG